MKPDRIFFYSILIVGFFVSSINIGFCSDKNESHKLSIHVKNIKAHKGSIFIAVYNNTDNYMKDRVYEQIKPVTDIGSLNIEMNMPYGNYAITIFHDVNSNEDLDANFIGIPKEPYGFSNNAKGSFGPPDYDASKFEFRSEGQEIEIELK